MNDVYSGKIPTETTGIPEDDLPKRPITGMWTEFLAAHLPEPAGEDVGTEDPTHVAAKPAASSD